MIGDKARKAGEDYGVNIGQVPGHGEFFGGAARADGLRQFAGVIARTPGGKVIDLGPHLQRRFVLGIVGGRKPTEK